jgi:cell division protein FtsW
MPKRPDKPRPRAKSSRHLLAKSPVGRIDFILLVLVVILLGFGAMMIYDASIVSAARDFGDKFFYVKNQLLWIGVGLVALLVTSRIDYHIYYRLALPAYLICLVLLILVFIPMLGIGAYGAHRWLDFRVFSFQPSEVMKLVLVMFLAAWLSSRESLKGLKESAIPFLAIVAPVVCLIILQPDMGTMLVIVGMAFTVYFASGANVIYFASILGLGAGGFLVFALTSAYRRARILTFLNPTSDTRDTGYHINQVLMSLGSGGIFGEGIGQSRGKYDYVPEVANDSIFAVIGEELGFIGSLLLFAALGFFLYRGFHIASAAPDRFGQLLATGIVGTIAIQTILNLGSMVSLFPLTGVPLPFISYGGSNMVVTLASIGILLNISRQVRSE